MLVDLIYKDWYIFVAPVAAPGNSREEKITERQAAVRKDIERMFGCFQERFKILRQEMHEWKDEMIIMISKVCIILHNNDNQDFFRWRVG